MNGFEFGNPAAKLNPPGITPKAIVNAWSTSGWTAVTAAVVPTQQVKSITVGALTAGVLKTVLSVTGSGMLNLLMFCATTASTGTIRIVITLDGAVAFDSTSAGAMALNSGLYVVGCGNGAVANIPNLGAIPFSQSLLIQVADSISETCLTAGVVYSTD